MRKFFLCLALVVLALFLANLASVYHGTRAEWPLGLSAFACCGLLWFIIFRKRDKGADPEEDTAP